MGEYMKTPEGKAVGELIGEVYHAYKNDYMFIRQGWGISKSIIDNLVEKGCKTIIIHDLIWKKKYRCDISLYSEAKVEQYFPHDEQYFGKEDDMEEIV